MPDIEKLPQMPIRETYSTDHDSGPIDAEAETKAADSDSTNNNNNNNTGEGDDQYPLDTSLRGWLAVIGGFASLFVSFGWVTCIGEFQAYYSTHKLAGYGASTIGWIPSAETFFLFLGVPIFGGLFDHLGPTVLFVVGTALHVGGLLGLANSDTYVQIFFTQGVISAIGTGAIFVAGTTAVSTWFKTRRGLALGLASSGSAVGSVTGTAVIPVLVENIGFAWTMRAVALVYFVLMAVAIAITSSRPQPSNNNNGEKSTLPAPFRISQLVPVSPLRSVAVSTLAAACFFYFVGIYIPFNYIKVEALNRGDGANSANNLLVILNTLSFVGRIVPGWLGDRYGRFNTVIALNTFNLVLVLGIWIAAPWRAGRVAFAALYGFGSGTFVAMVPTLIAQVCPDMRKMGLHMGAVYLAVSPSTLVCQPIGGVLADAGRGYERDPYVWLKVICAVAMFVGILLFVTAQVIHRRCGGKLWKGGKA